MSVVRQAAIVGVGQTEFSKQSGRSELQLACEAVRAAIADAGLQPADVDGLVDQQHRDAILDAVSLVQARVVEHTVDQQQRTPVSRAHQDAQELVVEHGAPTG